MCFKKIFSFQKRGVDWWGFTLLPLSLIFGLAILVLMKFGTKKEILVETLVTIIKQFLSYAIILSSTDLGLKSKSIEKNKEIVPPLFIIVFAAMALSFLYTNKEFVINSLFNIFLYSIISLIFVYSSIFLYNNNPESSDVTSKRFTETKQEKEDMAKKLYKSPKTKSNIKVKWGNKK